MYDKEYQKQYKIDHKEELKAKDKIYRNKPEVKKRIKENNKQYWSKNKDKLKQHNNDYYQQHKEQFKKYRKDWEDRVPKEDFLYMGRINEKGTGNFTAQFLTFLRVKNRHNFSYRITDSRLSVRKRTRLERTYLVRSIWYGFLELVNQNTSHIVLTKKSLTANCLCINQQT